MKKRIPVLGCQRMLGLAKQEWVVLEFEARFREQNAVVLRVPYRDRSCGAYQPGMRSLGMGIHRLNLDCHGHTDIGIH